MVTEKIRLIGVASTILFIIVICNFHKKVYFPKVNPAGKLVAVWERGRGDIIIIISSNLIIIILSIIVTWYFSQWSHRATAMFEAISVVGQHSPQHQEIVSKQRTGG